MSATIVNLRNMANDIGNVTKAQNEMLGRYVDWKEDWFLLIFPNKNQSTVAKSEEATFEHLNRSKLSKNFRIEAKNNSDIQRVAMAVKQAAALNS